MALGWTPEEEAFARDVLARNLLPGWGLREGETVESRLAYADASREDDARDGHEADGGAEWCVWCACNWYREGDGLLDEGAAGEEFGRFGIHGGERTFWGFWRAVLGRVVADLEKALRRVVRDGSPECPVAVAWRRVLEARWDWGAVAAAGITFRTRERFAGLLEIHDALQRGQVSPDGAEAALEWLASVRDALGTEVGGALARLAERGAARAQGARRRERDKAERDKRRDLLRKEVERGIVEKGLSIRDTAAILEITPGKVRRVYAELQASDPEKYKPIQKLRSTPARDYNEGRELNCGFVDSIHRKPKTKAQFIAEHKRREAAKAKARKNGKADKPPRVYRSTHVQGLPETGEEIRRPEGGWVPPGVELD